MGKYILIEVANEQYGVPVEQVKSIEYLRPVTRVPGAASFVKGVMNLRGVVVAVIDLNERLGLKGRQKSEENRILVIQHGNIEAGLMVDSANTVIELDESRFQESETTASFIQGIVRLEERTIAILNLEAVLERKKQDG
ncbi:chemotaxis protein CheW [Alicyclobacillus tolerans]|uniref:chemotaxis protein CheW n=1 Tax=Alicyclobacillus tolerans TaxID=90970 RepID=UPI001F026F25|nr:chemotaxis protein CheW [Alicyclobacillus tolerans]MCF8568064.1 chemotaxis protein CheW [Alicyclobacillus tolerans]